MDPITYPPDNSNIYIRLGDACLENYYFNHMVATDGEEAWMDDSALNTALEALRQDLACETHGIDIVNANISQICYCIENPEAAADRSNDVFRERFQGKNWIFVPINDGMARQFDVGRRGTHWSLAIVDRIHKRRFYYDSLQFPGNAIEGVAQEATSGLIMLIGDDPDDFTWEPQRNSPNQMVNNQYIGDEGPCAAFVWFMSEFLIHCIKAMQREEKEVLCDLSLGENFPLDFGTHFHSMNVKWWMRNLIEKFRRAQDAADEALPAELQQTQAQGEGEQQIQPQSEHEMQSQAQSEFEEQFQPQGEDETQFQHQNQGEEFSHPQNEGEMHFQPLRSDEEFIHPQTQHHESFHPQIEPKVYFCPQPGHQSYEHVRLQALDGVESIHDILFQDIIDMDDDDGSNTEVEFVDSP